MRTLGDAHEYRRWHPFLGVAWVPAFILARNAHPALRGRVLAPMVFLGKHSLELYLLQSRPWASNPRVRSALPSPLPPTDWVSLNTVSSAAARIR